MRHRGPSWAGLGCCVCSPQCEGGVRSREGSDGILPSPMTVRARSVLFQGLEVYFPPVIK